MSAERVFAGTYITEAEVRDRAIAWVPEVMRFANSAEPVSDEQDELDAEDVTLIGSANDDCPAPREMAA
jgi:ParB family chromosome partitioning protein